jgi:hypothetical protein
MRERGVDVILCPSYAGVGAVQGTPTYWLYTAIWNALDQPAVCFPSNVVADKELDKADTAYEPRSDVDKKEWEACGFFPRFVLDIFDSLTVNFR